MKAVYNLMSFAAALAMIIVLLITSVELVAYYEPGFYEREYRKYKVQEDVKMEMADILYVTDEMMDYLKGYREDLVVETRVDGEAREFFNDREKAHMADVRTLFLGGIRLRRYMLLLAVFCIGTLISMEEETAKRISRAYLIACGCFLTAVLELTFYLSRDFTRGFTQFHHIFFDNDLWLLDPKTDLLINILPEGFFVDIAAHIGLVFGFLLLVFAAASAACLIVQKVKMNKNDKKQ